jgi:hypothetical protein
MAHFVWLRFRPHQPVGGVATPCREGVTYIYIWNIFRPISRPQCVAISLGHASRAKRQMSLGIAGSQSNLFALAPIP